MSRENVMPNGFETTQKPIPTRHKHYKNYIGLSLLEIYNNIKKFFELKTLPNLTEEELFEFCKIYYMGDFNKCDFSRIKDCEFK